MDFTALNKRGQLTDEKPFRRINELELNKVYKLVAIKAVKTGFGRKIRVECEEFLVYLPARFDDLTDEEICSLRVSIQNTGITFLGVKDYGKGKKANLIEFVKW